MTNMSRRSLIFFVLVVLSLGSLGNRVVNRSVGGGGGSPAWHDSFTQGAEDGYTPASYNGQIFGGDVTPSVSGNATKVRVRLGFANQNGAMKIALLTTAGAVLGSGTVSIASSDDESWKEVSITPVAVTSGTTYIVMYVLDSNATGQGRKLAAQGGRRENYDQVYASFPSGTVSLSASQGTDCPLVGVEVTP